MLPVTLPWYNGRAKGGPAAPSVTAVVLPTVVASRRYAQRWEKSRRRNGLPDPPDSSQGVFHSSLTACGDVASATGHARASCSPHFIKSPMMSKFMMCACCVFCRTCKWVVMLSTPPPTLPTPAPSSSPPTSPQQCLPRVSRGHRRCLRVGMPEAYWGRCCASVCACFRCPSQQLLAFTDDYATWLPTLSTGRHLELRSSSIV